MGALIRSLSNPGSCRASQSVTARLPITNSAMNTHPPGQSKVPAQANKSTPVNAIQSTALTEFQITRSLSGPGQPACAGPRRSRPFFPAAHRDRIHGTSNGVLQMRHTLAAAAAISTLLISPLRAEVLDRTKDVDGTTVHYKVVLP